MSNSHKQTFSSKWYSGSYLAHWHPPRPLQYSINLTFFSFFVVVVVVLGFLVLVWFGLVFKTGFLCVPWLSWKSLCRPHWSQAQRFTCLHLCLPSAGIFFFFYLFGLVFKNRVSLCFSPDCPRTQLVDQVDLKLTGIKDKWRHYLVNLSFFPKDQRLPRPLVLIISL